jgi:hypothetical protein
LTVITSPVFALQSPDDLEPLKNYAAIARANNAAMEAALVQRATPAGLPDLNAEVAARAALAAQWQTKPVTQVRASAALALTGNWTLLSFGTVELDEYAAPDTSMWAAATPNRLIARRAGVYAVAGVVTADVGPAAAFSISARLSKNSNNVATAGLLPAAQTRATVSPNQYGGLSVATRVRLAAGDHVQLWGSVSASVNTVVGGDIASGLSLEWLRP